MNKKVEEAVGAFAASGIRMTVQREVLLRVLFLNSSHPTAEELYMKISSEHTGLVSRTTIYNNLRALKGLGLVKEFYLHHSGAARYDTNTEPHHHFLCALCGGIEDFTAAVPHSAFQAAGEQGFRAEQAYMEITGVCAACEAADGIQPGRRLQAI